MWPFLTTEFNSTDMPAFHPLKIDVFVSTLLFLGAKSFSHSFAAIAKYPSIYIYICVCLCVGNAFDCVLRDRVMSGLYLDSYAMCFDDRCEEVNDCLFLTKIISVTVHHRCHPHCSVSNCCDQSNTDTGCLI